MAFLRKILPFEICSAILDYAGPDSLGKISSLNTEEKAIVETQFAKHTRFVRVYDFNTPTPTTSNVHETRRAVFRNFTGDSHTLAVPLARMPHLQTLDIEIRRKFTTSFENPTWPTGLHTLGLRANGCIIVRGLMSSLQSLKMDADSILLHADPLSSQLHTLDIKCRMAYLGKLPSNITNLSLEVNAVYNIEADSMADIVAQLPHLSSFTFKGPSSNLPVTWQETLTSLSLEV